jgi:2-oxoisovalerate dehydrogenase E1 component alpha subunit
MLPPKETLLEMYWYMLLSRRLDERAWVLHRERKISFHISAIGHEAIQIGAAFAVNKGKDYIVPYYRDLGLLIALGLTPRDYMLSLMGKREDPSSGGRQMPNHWSLKSAKVISHSSLVASQTPHATGIGLGIKLSGGDEVVLTTIGEGATSQGEWYEAVNWSAIHKLPVVYLVENNLYAISTHQDKQMAVKNVADKAMGLGVPGITVDGTDFTSVFRVVTDAVNHARRGEGPAVIEAQTYRITPHSSDDDDRLYRSRDEVEQYQKRDPLLIARTFLEAEDILTLETSRKFEDDAGEQIEEAVRFAESAPLPSPQEGAIPVYAEQVNDG